MTSRRIALLNVAVAHSSSLGNVEQAGRVMRQSVQLSVALEMLLLLLLPCGVCIQAVPSEPAYFRSTCFD
jgi:hypothetical protein